MKQIWKFIEPAVKTFGHAFLVEGSKAGFKAVQDSFTNQSLTLSVQDQNKALEAEIEALKAKIEKEKEVQNEV